MTIATGRVRKCWPHEDDLLLSIINSAAQVYHGSIPDDCWHDPYMSRAELSNEIRSGVTFWGYEDAGDLVGVMGIQPVREVDLIRHAYVVPGNQKRGIGSALITHLKNSSTRPMLVGTWAAAKWAIEFYERHAFTLISGEQKDLLLRRYWRISPRQIETSVVLVDERYAALHFA